MKAVDGGNGAAGRKKRGRADGVQLSPVCIKGLREEADLTQEQVAQGMHRLLHPKGSPTSDKAQLTTYQRIEGEGRTSRKRAEALARFHGTTVAVLQGDTPEDGPTLSRRIETQVRSQLAAGASPALLGRLERMQGDGDHVEWLAEDLALEAEEAQLPQITVELSRIACLIGWSERQVQNAGAQLGYWTLVSALRRISHITTGLQSVLQIVKDESVELLRIVGTDATITFREELPWLRIEISSRRWVRSGRPPMVFSVVRCLPTSRGIEWQNPTWRDRSWLDWYLPRWAYTQAEFVNWQGKTRPRDVRQLRLLIERCVGSGEPEQVAVHEGDLPDVSEEYLQRLVDTDAAHEQVLCILRVELFDALVPHLMNWPLEHWRVNAGEAGIAVTLDLSSVPYRVVAGAEQRPANYAIRLVELDNAKLWPAPWRQASLEAVAKHLFERLTSAIAEVAIGPPRPDRWQGR
ncbi:hypothetical protein ACPWT1_02995 [Ramlibacter sp. MMS24-I3-19]|uniref:hypothetical protein n=1 Tax=Ramlibacter sp. MMS24-I3-19 TaxID=3416606 RepID=UPI003CFCC921